MTPMTADRENMDLSVKIRETRTWEKLMKAFRNGQFPQALAVEMPSALFSSFALTLARELLCLKLSEGEPCPSCRSWAKDEHPDLLLSGPTDETPGIDRCRTLWGELTLRPVVAKQRMAVFFNADKLSPGAANSMLKMTEEPPGDSFVVLLHDGGNILPTLRSRTWNLVISGEELTTPVKCPKSPEDWAAWLGKTTRLPGDKMDLEIQGIVSYLLEEQKPLLAEDLETIRLYARKGNLSVNMVQDLVFLLLKEEKPIGQLFADLW